MWKKVDSYSLYWDASDRIGTVYLKLSDDTEGSIKHLSKMEMAAFGDTLRNEDPGAPDPELNTSPIIEDTDEEFEVAAQEVEDLPVFFSTIPASRTGSMFVVEAGNYCIVIMVYGFEKVPVNLIINNTEEK